MRSPGGTLAGTPPPGAPVQTARKSPSTDKFAVAQPMPETVPTWGLGEVRALKPTGAPGSKQFYLTEPGTPPATPGSDASGCTSPRWAGGSRVNLTELMSRQTTLNSSTFESQDGLPKTIAEVGFSLAEAELSDSSDGDGSSQRDGFFSRRGCAWPVFVIPLDTFLGLDELPSHEAAVASGVAREWLGAERESMLFLSHQWLGFLKPDSEDQLQLRAAQGALASLREGRVDEVFETPGDAFRCLDAASERRVSGDLSWANEDFVEVVRRRLRKVLHSSCIWIDYSSISQRDEEALQRGVRSLPYYVENSALFLAVVPPGLHADLRVCCDRRSYADRGWCRFELLVAELAASTPCKLLVHSATSISVPSKGDYFIDDAQCDRSVFNGEFSCCRRTGGHKVPGTVCDRVRIARVLEPFFAERVAELHAGGKPWLARLWTCLESRVFAGNPSEKHRGSARLSHRRPRRRVVSRPDYGSNDRPDAIGSIPTYYWCAEGRLDKVLEGLEAGVDVNYAAAPGSTLLMEAALAGDLKLTRELLRRGADATARTHRLGITALHRAAQAGHDRVLEPLVDHGADVDARRHQDGETPLHRAAQSGRRRVLAELARLGAALTAEDARGRTALDHALAHAHTGAVAKLLALGAWEETPPPVARIGQRDAQAPDRVAAAAAAEAHLRWFYHCQDRWHGSHFRDREERARVFEAFRAFLAVGFSCTRRLGPGDVETLCSLEFADEIARAEHCDWTGNVGKIDLDVEPDEDGSYVVTARFKQRTEPPPDSPDEPADWSAKVRLRVWDAAPFPGAPPKMAAQLLHVRQTRLEKKPAPAPPAKKLSRLRFGWGRLFRRRSSESSSKTSTTSRPSSIGGTAARGSHYAGRARSQSFASSGAG